MSERMQIPNTDSYIYDGSIVILVAYPNIRWITHYGFYTLDTITYQGWYCTQIPTNDIIPLVQDDLIGCTLIYTPEGNPNIVPPEPSVEIPISIDTAKLKITERLEVVGDTNLNGYITVNDNRIENVGTPVADADAATKEYVDSKFTELQEMINQILNDGH